MNDPDVVAALEDHIHDAEHSTDYAIEWRRTLLAGLLARARDEIVALRKDRQDRDNEIVAGLVREMVISVARGQALEEAARVCELIAYTGHGPVTYNIWEACAAAIRALKGTRANE